MTRSLTDDIRPMLAADVVYRDDDALEAFERVWFGMIIRLNGEAWHKSEAVIDEFRATSLPNLLRSECVMATVRAFDVMMTMVPAAMMSPTDSEGSGGFCGD